MSKRLSLKQFKKKHPTAICGHCKKQCDSLEAMRDHIRAAHPETRVSIYTATELVVPPGTPSAEEEMEEDFEADWSQTCSACGQSPIVPVTGLCGPCTFGQADTAGGNF